jgi:L-threonylcarbamoyladenylate synthase
VRNGDRTMIEKQTVTMHFPSSPQQWTAVHHQQIEQAALALRAGELVAFPTETVYGLGADARSESAVQMIFMAKGRPSDNPLIVHYADLECLRQAFPSLPTVAEKLLQAFAPGPLTLILPRCPGIADRVTAGLSTVAVRIPAHPLAAALLRAADIPVAAPSANRSGRPSPTKATHVYQDLKGRITYLLDGGEAAVGLESTVVDVTQHPPAILRPGGVTQAALEKVIGPVQPAAIAPLTDAEAPRAPGMKYRHYAPQGKMILFAGHEENVRQTIQQQADAARQAGQTVGILTTEEHRSAYSADLVLACGRRSDPESVAQGLYHTLLQFDQAGIQLILSETFPLEGLYFAVMNRLLKAADGQVYTV